MDQNQLKRDGLVFGRNFQRAYKLVMLYGIQHASSEAPAKQAYDALNALLKHLPQFTFGFYNRRVVLLCYKCDKRLGWPRDHWRQAHRRNALQAI
jgi:hypothetical protein